MPTEPAPTTVLFPSPESGAVGPYSIVCLGGDFSPGTLLAAYRRGIFPWPVSTRTVPWCSPDPRAVFRLDEPIQWGSSMKRAKKRGFTVTFDRAFDDVMAGCADREEGTWIIPKLVRGFRELYALGWAHSVEVWNPDGGLVGGLYGLAIGGFFAGESMFSRETDGSKMAFATLMEHLKHQGFIMFDAQVMTSHLESLGCRPMARVDFLPNVAKAQKLRVAF